MGQGYPSENVSLLDVIFFLRLLDRASLLTDSSVAHISPGIKSSVLLSGRIVSLTSSDEDELDEDELDDDELLSLLSANQQLQQ